MKKVVGHNDKVGRGKNGKDKNNKTNLMMQLPLTSIPWYVQFRRLTTYKQDQREYVRTQGSLPAYLGTGLLNGVKQNKLNLTTNLLLFVFSLQTIVHSLIVTKRYLQLTHNIIGLTIQYMCRKMQYTIGVLLKFNQNWGHM